MGGDVAITIETFLRVPDLGGTFVFAISGALAAVNRRLDVFGILILCFVAGNFGGITRDVLIGAVPPAALTDGRYLLVAVLAGASVVVIGHMLDLPYGASALLGGALCFGLRFMAIKFDWHLPGAHLSAQGRAGIDSQNEKKPPENFRS